jgi:hypothetical protein
VNGDNSVTALDALLIINYLNTHPSGEGETSTITAPDELGMAWANEYAAMEFHELLDILGPDIATQFAKRRRY